MSSDLVLVVDQGSTSTEAGVFRLDGERLASSSTAVERSVDGAAVHHDPEKLAAGVSDAIEELVGSHPVGAIGLACQRSTCLVWERQSGAALTPALSWQDRSQAGRVEALTEHAETIQRRTGLRLAPYYAAPKLAALLEGLPRGLERAARGELVAGTLDAFLVQRLTGRPATEGGIAGRTLLYDLERDAWSEDLCELFGVPVAALPQLRASTGDWGEVSYGGDRHVPLLAVAGDQQASLIGHGGWRLGVTAAHFGTGAFVLASTGGEIVRHDGLLSAVLASTPSRRRFQIEGSVNSAGSAVDWAAGLTGTDLEAWAGRELPVDGPLALPSFTGAGAPWWRPGACGVIAGLGLESSGEALFAAVLAGVAHRVLDCVEALGRAGVETEVLRVSGKLTRLRGLVRLLADGGQIPVEITAEEETGSLGLVRLLAAAVDEGKEPLSEPPPTAARLEPAWSHETARWVRRRWSEFAERALEI